MTVVQDNADIEAALSTLRALLFDRNTFGSSKLERHQNLAMATYTLRRSRAIEAVLYSSHSANSKSKKLWVNICLLARLRIAHQTFKEIAITLPSFQNPTIILIPRPSAPAPTVQSALTLSQTFGLLHLPLNTTTTKAMLGRSWTVARLDREFKKPQKQKLNTHAEVQMLMFLHANEASASGVLPYLGCSKLSCFMCDRFLQAYGSKSCQEKRSGPHLFTCSKRPLTSADYLWKSLGEDLMPPDEEVLEDFGFNNAVAGQDKTYLLGLYQGLYLSDRVSSEDIHAWRTAGVLVDKIKDFYYSLPEGSRGGYFPWFLENTHVLDGSLSREEAQQKLAASFYDRARAYLDGEDRYKTAGEMHPEAKGNSYNLLAGMLLRFNPNPIEQNWHSFGFVTCRGKGEESSLVDIYQLLLTESDGSIFYETHNRERDNVAPATFTQFWKAHEAGTLIQLMDSKGLKKLRSRLPFLESFLCGARPSVWHLKQFLEISDPISYPPVLSVRIDYGFVNCRSFEDTCMLMEIYGQILRVGNPLELHQACLAGELFQFASRYIRMDERWKSLMQNHYPLGKVDELERGPGPEESAKLLSLLSNLWSFHNLLVE
ncbi:hypothetical protein N0V94_002319 [Neodidymelliopsis sp. IMI 364377]|nr:hypothetical protein N0V94_002319 [Neodidymelliopsis sp. IMI 364377]